MLVSSGNAFKSAVSASRPPAEAPMPATGKRLAAASSGTGAVCAVVPLVGLADALPPTGFRPALESFIESRMPMGKFSLLSVTGLTWRPPARVTVQVPLRNQDTLEARRIPQARTLPSVEACGLRQNSAPGKIQRPVERAGAIGLLELVLPFLPYMKRPPTC
jgi:hypothetical protein